MKEYYLVTITNDEKQRIFKAEQGDRIITNNKKYITVGVTKNKDLPENIKIEPLTKENKSLLKKTKKLTIK